MSQATIIRIEFPYTISIYNVEVKNKLTQITLWCEDIFGNRYIRYVSQNVSDYRWTFYMGQIRIRNYDDYITFKMMWL